MARISQASLYSNQQSSLRHHADGAPKGNRRKGGKAKVARHVAGATHVAHIKYVPEAAGEEENGWQLRCEDTKARIGTLFNCYTMADVVFRVEVHSIPAHKFILSAASPVFYRQFYEESEPMGYPYSQRLTDPHSGGMHGPGTLQQYGRVLARNGSVSESVQSMSMQSWLDSCNAGPMTLNIYGIPHLAFFEFLQFIYTDSVHITLENVLDLIFLADSYKVAGLNDRCFEFIRSEVVPHGVVRVLRILRTLLLKAVVTLWHEIVEHKKLVHRFRQMSLAERRAKMEEMTSACDSSIAGSLPASRRSSISSSSRRSGGSRARSRAGSMRGSLTERSQDSAQGYYRDSSDEEQIEDDITSVLDMAQGFHKRAMKFDTGFKGQMMKLKIVSFVEELTQRCWKCIQEETELVINCDDIWHEDISLLRKILSLDTCSVQEIVLFRAMCEYAERVCDQRGLVPNSDNKKDVLGQETIQLIRFPAMTVEQLQWEVVPSGLLSYEDVQQLLYTMTSRTITLGRYNSKPRSNKTLQAKTRNFGDSDIGASAPKLPIYSSVPDDPLDSMLGAEFLRTFLKTTTEECDPAGSQQGGARFGPGAYGATTADGGGYRLPPISPPSASRGLASMASPRRQQIMKQVEMVMGSRIDEEEVEEGVVLRGGGRRPQPTDFVRLCSGFYRFRDERLVELWLDDGEAMVLDHGFNSKLHTLIPGAGLDGLKVREILGVAGTTAHQRMGSVPLASFLCRQ